MYEFLDRRYALALFNTCTQKGNTKLVLDELKEIVDQFNENEGIKKILKNPQINKYNKKRIFEEMFKGKIESELLDFLLLLIEKNRILHLNEKYEQFRLIYLDSINTVIAKVTSAVPLSSEETESLRAKLQNKYGKSVIIEAHEDKSLIGGVVVNIADEVIDGTLKNKLKDVEGLVSGKSKMGEYWKNNNDVIEYLDAEVTTSIPLSEEELNNMADGLAKLYGKKMHIKHVVDKEVLDGVRVKVGEDVIDQTLKSRLKDIKRETFDIMNKS